MKSDSGKVLFFILFLTLSAMTVVAGTIKGTVTDKQTREPLTGATIQIAGTTQGTVADVDGNVLFFYNTDYVQAFVTALGAKNPLIFVVLFVGVQGLIEAGICFIVASVVSRALYAALKLNQN